MSSTQTEAALQTFTSEINAASPPIKSQNSWLISPTFDLLLVSNLTWPVIAILAASTISFISQPITILQLYFLSSPHRWITLALVFGGNERFWKEPLKYGLVTLGILLLGVVLFWVPSLSPAFTNSFALLLMVDYFWNSWHFAAQHAGVARIYERKAVSGASDFRENTKSSLRILVLWTFVQIGLRIGSSGEFLGADTFQLIRSLTIPVDVLAIAYPLIIFKRRINSFQNSATGLSWKIYWLSVICLYATQLFAIRFVDTRIFNSVLLAAAVFHSIEYMAIVSWSVRRRSDGIWSAVIPRLGTAFVAFIVVIGIINWVVATKYMFTWIFATLLVSLLHYCYDGMIWKVRPKT